MIDSERVKLLYGPYRAPRCAVGDRLVCECRGRELTVSGMTDAPISWPLARVGGGASLIVCGELTRAIRTESKLAIAHHWGIKPATVWKWRRALGATRTTNGTRRLLIEWSDENFTPEFRQSEGCDAPGGCPRRSSVHSEGTAATSQYDRSVPETR